MEEQNLSKFSIFNPNLLIQDWFDPNLTWPLIIIFNTKRVREVKDIHCDKMSYTNVSKSMRGGGCRLKKRQFVSLSSIQHKNPIFVVCAYLERTQIQNTEFGSWKPFPGQTSKYSPFFWMKTHEYWWKRGARVKKLNI